MAPWRAAVAGRHVEIEVSGSVVVNDFPTMLEAALGGAGIAQVPGPIARGDLRSGRLEEVLNAFAPQTVGVFLCHTGRRQVLPKLRVFIEHLQANVPLPSSVQVGDTRSNRNE